MGRAKGTVTAIAQGYQTRSQVSVDDVTVARQALDALFDKEDYNQLVSREYKNASELWKTFILDSEENTPAIMEITDRGGLPPNYRYDMILAHRLAGMKHPQALATLSQYMQARLNAEKDYLVRKGILQADDEVFTTKKSDISNTRNWNALMAANMFRISDELSHMPEGIPEDEKRTRQYVADGAHSVAMETLDSQGLTLRPRHMQSVLFHQGLTDPKLASMRKVLYSQDYMTKHQQFVKNDDGHPAPAPVIPLSTEAFSIVNLTQFEMMAAYMPDSNAIVVRADQETLYKEIKEKGLLSPFIVHELIHSHQGALRTPHEEDTMGKLVTEFAFLEGSTEEYARQINPTAKEFWREDSYPFQRAFIQAMGDYAQEQGKMSKEEFVKALALAPSDQRSGKAYQIVFNEGFNTALVENAVYAKAMLITEDNFNYERTYTAFMEYFRRYGKL